MDIDKSGWWCRVSTTPVAACPAKVKTLLIQGVTSVFPFYKSTHSQIRVFGLELFIVFIGLRQIQIQSKYIFRALVDQCKYITNMIQIHLEYMTHTIQIHRQIHLEYIGNMCDSPWFSNSKQSTNTSSILWAVFFQHTTKRYSGHLIT